MLDTARQQSGRLQVESLPIDTGRLNRHRWLPIDMKTDSWQAQAPLFLLFEDTSRFAGDLDLGIDKDPFDSHFIITFGHVHDEDACIPANLGSRQSDALMFVHQFEHSTYTGPCIVIWLSQRLTTPMQDRIWIKA